MTHEPYDAAAVQPFQAQRTSVLAVLGVVCSILCLPPTGLIAIILGGLALGNISRAKGRLEGRGAAITGMILGVITTTLWVAVGFGVLLGWTYYKKNMVGTGDSFFQAALVQDYDGVRALMTTAGAEDLPDSQIEWFMGEIEARSGEVIGAYTSLGTMGQAFGEVFGKTSGQGSPNDGFNIRSDGSNAVVPVAIECAGDSILAWIVFDEDSLAAGDPRIADMFVLFSNKDVIALRHDGPAVQEAQFSGIGAPTAENDAPEAPAAPEPAEGTPDDETPDPA